jgi:hypothetical protein
LRVVQYRPGAKIIIALASFILQFLHDVSKSHYSNTYHVSINGLYASG